MHIGSKEELVLNMLDDMIETELDKHNISRVDDKYLEEEVARYVDKYKFQLEPVIEDLKEAFNEGDGGRSSAEKVADTASDAIQKGQEKTVESIKANMAGTKDFIVGNIVLKKLEKDIDISEYVAKSHQEVISGSKTSLDNYRIIQDFGADLTKPYTIVETLEEMVQNIIYENELYTDGQKVTFAVFNMGSNKDKAMHLNGKSIAYMAKHIPDFKLTSNAVGCGLMKFKGSKHEYILMHRPENKFMISRSVKSAKVKVKASSIKFDKDVDMKSLQKFVDYDFKHLVERTNKYIGDKNKENMSLKKSVFMILESYATGKAIDWSVASLSYFSKVSRTFLAKASLKLASKALYWLYMLRLIKALYFVVVTRNQLLSALARDLPALANPYPLVNAVAYIK